MKKDLEDLALEIVEIQDEIENAKKRNKISNLKCNMKKIKALVKLGITISIVPTIGTIIATTTGNNPFKLNEKEVPALITTTIDEDGKIEEKKDYYYDDYECNKIYYYTEWEKTNKNNYERKKYEYKILKDLPIEIIIDITKNNININQEQLEELLYNYEIFNYNKSKINFETEIKAYLPKEKNQNSHISAIINKIDEEDTITRIETKEEHEKKLFFGIAIEMIIMFIPEFIILIISKDLDKIIDELKSKPDIKDIEALEKRLKSRLLLLEQTQYQTIEEKQFEKLLEQEKTKILRYKQGQY